MTYIFPSTLTGPPISSLVPPGLCQFGESPLSVPLLDRTKVSPTSFVLRFGLPDPNEPLNLSTCACILSNAEINGEDVTRPYTPISTNQMIGSFDLLIKDYGKDAKMSHYLCSLINVGDKVNFKHIPFNVKTQAPFPDDEILLVVGGAGITPFIQALHAILGSEGKKPKVTMLYGSRVKEDILGRELLDKWAEEYADQFKLFHILSHEPEDSSWEGGRGFITREWIEKCFPSPDKAHNCRVFVCGPPPLYNAICGDRSEKEVGGVLGEMGYKPEHVYKF